MLDDALSTVLVRCPYCGETVELVVEEDLVGEMVHDCEVCCNPWQLNIIREGPSRRVEAARLDD